MTIDETMGHWYKCIACPKKIPLPDFKFVAQDGKKDGKILIKCLFCGETLTSEFSNAGKPCTEKDAVIAQQKKDGKIRFESYWEKG
jgi:hypothetical protein